jgi:hypothetical protein
MLQESIELILRWNLQELTELMAGQPLHPICVDREGFQRRPGQILTVLGELRHDVVVREIQPDTRPIQ